MKSIAIALIAKNEEAVIARCLKSLQHLTNQIAVVDTGSTDKTVEIAESLGAKVGHFEWCDDFAKARNFSFEFAASVFPDHTHTMWVDADDILREEDAEKIKRLLEKTDYDAYLFQYVYTHDELDQPIDVFPRERISRRSCNFKWEGFVHEVLSISGSVHTSTDIFIHQYQPPRSVAGQNRNLRIYAHHVKRLGGIKKLSPRDCFYYAKEIQGTDDALSESLYRAFVRMPEAWWEDRAYAYYQLALLAINRRGDRAEARAMAFKSISVKHTMAEAYCLLGLLHVEKKEWAIAVHWYENAAKCESMRDENVWGIRSLDPYTWLPHLQLALCHSHLGNVEKAWEHNEIARGFKPQDSRIQHNFNYLKALREQNNA